MARISLRRTAFRQWLKEKRPDDVVGMSSTKCTCPIATYLTSRGERPVVGLTKFSHSYGHQKLPEWAVNFIIEVDGGGNVSPITAGDALRILDRPS